ncbi:unnamed protein product, partial [marine sediment metagenome]
MNKKKKNVLICTLHDEIISDVSELALADFPKG